MRPCPARAPPFSPFKARLPEEAFQTILVSKALEKLGYPSKRPRNRVRHRHLALANGDATFMATIGIRCTLTSIATRAATTSCGGRALMCAIPCRGYLIDKKTADQYKITHISQLSDPALAKLFDTNGDGKAGLDRLQPGWGCELVIEHQLTAYRLRGTVTHNQGSYAALIADTIARYKQASPSCTTRGRPTGSAACCSRTGRGLAAGAALIAARRAGQTQHPAARREGLWLHGQHQRIVANKAFAQKNPAAAKLFEVMQLPVADVNAQNLRMRDGENKPQDIERHVNGWIKAHQKTFDGWVAQALAAAR